MGKRRYITFKVDEDLPDVAGLRSQGRAREPLGVQCGRCMRFCGFCLVCTCTFFQALAPWMLSVIELGALLLLLLLLLLPHHPPGPYVFDFHNSLEDLVLLSGLRAAAICGTYAYGSSRYNLRPYLWTSYITGLTGLTYAVVKACVYMYPVTWLPPAAMMTSFGTFSWLHILAARYTVTWYRRRGQLGLLQGPFQPSLGLRHSASTGSLAASHSNWPEDSSADLPPELLADPDSQFADVDGLVVHYKEAWPSQEAFRQWHGLPAGQSSTPVGSSSSSSQQHWQMQQAAGSLLNGAAAAPAAAVVHEPPGTPTSQLSQPELASKAAAAATATATAAAAARGGNAGKPAMSGVLGPDTAIVLLHGFGGGTFAWRHLLHPLAVAVGSRVIAFDRPGFGLTARPEVENQHSSDAGASSERGTATEGASMGSKQAHQSCLQALQNACCGSGSKNSSNRQPLLPSYSDQQQQQQQRRQQQQPSAVPEVSEFSNPYTLEAQALLTLRFCQQLGLRKVLLVGHADGCLVAVHAAALACRLKQQSQQQQQQVGGDGSSSSSRWPHRPGRVDIQNLQSEGSVDFSWMGSLGKDPTPRMIARGAQAVMQQAAAAAGGGGGNTSGTSSLASLPPPAPSSPSIASPDAATTAAVVADANHQLPVLVGGSSAGANMTPFAAAAGQQQLTTSSPPGLTNQASPVPEASAAAAAVAVDSILVNRTLDDIREYEGAEGGGSAASSLSFQSMLLAASSSRSGSRQHLADAGCDAGLVNAGSEGGSVANASTMDAAFSERGSSEGGSSTHRGPSWSGTAEQQQQQQGQSSSAAAAAAAAAGSGCSQQLTPAGSLVLKPPLPQPPMKMSSDWEEITAAGGGPGAGGGRLPPTPPGPSSNRSSSGGGYAPGLSRGPFSAGTSSHWNSGSSSGSGLGSAAAAGVAAAGVAGVKVAGLVLLHPNLSGHQVPAFTRLLAGSSLGRSMLRPLLRSEVGEVTNRRAWHNPDLLTREVLALYKQPLRVQGWDAALLATCRATGSLSQKQVLAQFAAVRHVPVLLVTGEYDRIATPGKVAGVAALLPRARRAVVPACGHLSHEEAPQPLMELMVPFCRERLLKSSAAAAAAARGGRESSRSPTRLRGSQQRQQAQLIEGSSIQ